MNPFDDRAGSWVGTCGFRLMPTDELALEASTAEASGEADGWGWLLRYTWTHPDDGVQSGVLLVGSPDDDGAISAGWVDSWHQKPRLRELVGVADEGGVHLEMEYDGWGWTIDVRRSGDDLTMTMHNVVPSGFGDFEGAYLVMDAEWRRVLPQA